MRLWLARIMLTSGGVGRVTKGAAIGLLVLSVLLALGELAARALYPAFVGRVHGPNLSNGEVIHFSPAFVSSSNNPSGPAAPVSQEVLHPDLQVRVGSAGERFTLARGDSVVLLVGDSITWGYGLAFEDIYWSHWLRRLELGGSRLRLLPIHGYGRNFVDNLEPLLQIRRQLAAHGIDVRAIVYQFNFNDILPYRHGDLDILARGGANAGWVDDLRYRALVLKELLNHSTLFQVADFAVRRLLGDLDGPCAALGQEALGQYTYTFGGEGFEQESAQLWQSFTANTERVVSGFHPVPVFVLVTPIARMIDPDLEYHALSARKRFDCATIDPLDRLERLAVDTGVILVDPSDYMKTRFDRYVAEGNPRQFFQVDDDNHLNALGARFFAEFGYREIFEVGLSALPRQVRLDGGDRAQAPRWKSESLRGQRDGGDGY